MGHKQVGLHLLSKFGGSNLNRWWVMAWASSKCGKFGISSEIWPWRSRSIAPQNNRDLNQVVLHLLAKFGGSSLNAWWFMARTSSGLTDTHTDRHTHRQTQATTIPEGQNWPRVKTIPLHVIPPHWNDDSGDWNPSPWTSRASTSNTVTALFKTGTISHARDL